MFHIVLYQPEIPPNTGNIIRLSANTGCQLHLIKPLGFAPDERRLRRAGLDYHDWAEVKIYEDIADYLQRHCPQRLFACTSKGDRLYSDVKYQAGDCFLLGPESRGLPEDIKMHATIQARIRIPMNTPTRSLNLANATAVIVYEAWRQCGYQSN